MKIDANLQGKIMGAWGVNPWDNDEAADWFHKFWTQGFSVLVSEIENFDEKNEENYETIRAAAYLLQTLGIVYIWPAAYLDKLKPLLMTTISILEKMLDPPNENWSFIDMWGGDHQVIESVKSQIAELTLRLSVIRGDDT